jgi:hypothetical protein
MEDRRMPRKVALLAVLATLLLAAPAVAEITPSSESGPVAAALADPLPPGALAGSALSLPPEGSPAAVGDSPLAGFPRAGGTYALLSTGDATFADDANESAGTGQSNSGGSGGHGTNVFDVVTLRVDLNVPADRNCLRFDLRFLSEEFDEFVGSDKNDAFVAELDGSDFTSDANNVVTAPRNFAFDTSGRLITVNTAAFAAAESTGTTYDGATPILRASTPITPGAHAVHLSIFDQGDASYDSAAFIDAMRLDAAGAGGCATGATADVTPPVVSLTSPAGGSRITGAPAYAGAAGDAAGDAAQVTVRTFAGGAATGTPVQTTTATRAAGAWSATGAALAPGTYTAVASQTDGAGNVGSSAPVTFTVAAPPTGPDRPETGKTVNVKTVKGKVRVKAPGGKFVDLDETTQIRTGSTVDTRKGTVELTSTGPGNTLQKAKFFDGLFKVTQTKGKKPITNLKLNEKLAKCPKGKGKAKTSAKKRKRRLWGDGKGNFRTSGRRSAAAVSGTKWLVEDSCKGTLTRVVRGKVKVRDFRKKKTITVKAGKRYLAK